METIIKIDPAELNESLLDKIRNLLTGRDNPLITITIQDKPSKSHLRSETREEYFARLDQSLVNIEKGNTISFTPEAFDDFSRQIDRRYP